MKGQQKQQQNKLGIYIHIPFCHRACSYCNFHFSVKHNRKEEFLLSLLNEIQLKQKEIGHSNVRSIYFGGGTPSVLSISEVSTILNEVDQYFHVSKDSEITFEVNPEDVSEQYLAGLKDLGINRISLGIQSFHSDAINILNRGHTEDGALKSIEITESLFHNYSVDLIYGIQQNDQFLSYSLDQLSQFQPTHLSAYQLTIEKHTVLGNQVKKGLFKAKQDEQIESDLSYLLNWTEARGIHQYEVSNFARLGKEAVHNSSYWEGLPYLGLGPSSSSYDGRNRRMQNIPNTQAYIQQYHNKPTSVEYWQDEALSKSDLLNEFMMLRFRTKAGIIWKEAERLFTAQEIQFLQERIHQYEPSTSFIHKTGRTYLNPKLFWLSDSILEKLWVEEKELPN